MQESSAYVMGYLQSSLRAFLIALPIVFFSVSMPYAHTSLKVSEVIEIVIYALIAGVVLGSLLHKYRYIPTFTAVKIGRRVFWALELLSLGYIFFLFVNFGGAGGIEMINVITVASDVFTIIFILSWLIVFVVHAFFQIIKKHTKIQSQQSPDYGHDAFGIISSLIIAGIYTFFAFVALNQLFPVAALFFVLATACTYVADRLFVLSTHMGNMSTKRTHLKYVTLPHIFFWIALISFTRLLIWFFLS